MSYSNSNSDQEWTHDENKRFENALAELDQKSPNFFENMRELMPWKTIEQIKIHYEKLVEDITMIENGEISSPNYEVEVVDVADDHKRRGVPWTADEHRAFLIGLSKLGKGEWSSISSLYVPTKTPSQVASHGQKYFRRLKCSTPVEKRRYSIHDIRLLNSSIVETPARQPHQHSLITPIPPPQPNHPILPPTQMMMTPLQDYNNVMIGQQQQQFTEITNYTNNPNDGGNYNSHVIVDTSAAYNLPGSSNSGNNPQMMGNDVNDFALGYDDDEVINYDDLFPASPPPFPWTY